MSNAVSLIAARADALLGISPVMTFTPDPGDASSCCSVRLGQVAPGRWIGLVHDRSAFADRVRMGMRPRFVVHSIRPGTDATPVVCGEAEARVCGRIGDDGAPPVELDARAAHVARTLAAQHPFAPRGLVVVEVKPRAIEIDGGEGPSHGAIPRT